MFLLTNQDVFDTLYFATKGKRLIVYGGVFKDYKRLYVKRELERYKEIDTNEYYWFMRSIWNKETESYESVYQELSENEKEKFNNKKINEIEID